MYQINIKGNSIKGISIQEEQESLKVLKVDIDSKQKNKAVNQIAQRLAYFHDIGFFDINDVKKILMIKKTSFSARIELNVKFKSMQDIVLLQSLLGSDYRKEVCTMINRYKLKNKHYANRMFDVKLYKEGNTKEAVYFDATKQVIDYVTGDYRKKNNM